ncbi:putative nickel resistance protein (nreB) [Corynebacterium kutscheri]|uniref:MFS transporter n=1 Tax=Corynebacterium kutscheri TaxID=35755 RepID=UPI000F6C48C7|nr:MFS transporter [Corynebacterium kutscheri]VEH80356.1 putative nickel resistance protein (nreB) [Corynebacterium kutscheri]
MLKVLTNRVYARLFSAQILALVGTGLLTVALGLLAYDIAGAHASLVLSTALSIKMVAYVFLSPVLTTLVRSLPPRTIMISADIIRAAVAASLLWIDQTWQIYVLIFLLQASSAIFTPTFQATIPEVLDDEEEYTNAISLSRLAYDLEAVFSPLLAAALLMVTGYHTLFIGTLAGFIASASLILSIHLPTPSEVDTHDTFMHRLTQGMRDFWYERPLRALIGLNLTVAASTALVMVNTVVIVRSYLDRSQAEVAFLLGCYGLGSMIIAFFAPRILQKVNDKYFMTVGSSITPVLLIIIGSVTLSHTGTINWSLICILWGLIGAANATTLVTSPRLLKRHSLASNRPALYTAQFSLSHACFLITYPLAGIFATSIGLSAATFILAALALSGVIWAVKIQYL